MLQKPKIIDTHIVARSRLFTIESLDLTFSNGVNRTYERLVPGGPGAVMMVPINQNGEVMMIREYGAGVEDYTLTLPKGAMDLGETAAEAANRELQEEIKFGAKTLIPLKQLSLSPSYMKSGIQVMLALDLYPCALEGDEPEPLDVVPWPMSQLEDLIMREDMTEGRAIAALYLAKTWLEQQSSAE